MFHTCRKLRKKAKEKFENFGFEEKNPIDDCHIQIYFKEIRELVNHLIKEWIVVFVI